MPRSLAELQAAFAAALVEPGRPLPPGVLGDAKRFAVYRNNVTVSLIEALQARFPVTARIVGEEFFQALARSFVQARKPASPLLFAYGDDLPGFIAGFPPAATLPYLPDVARLEVLWSRAYHAADAMPLTRRDLAAFAPDQLLAAGARLHPSLGLLRSPHPVVAIWAAHQTAGDFAPPSDWHAETALVLRPDAEVLVQALPGGADRFLAALQAGATLAEAGEAAAEAEKAFNLGRHLLGLVDLGALVALETEVTT